MTHLSTLDHHHVIHRLSTSFPPSNKFHRQWNVQCFLWMNEWTVGMIDLFFVIVEEAGPIEKEGQHKLRMATFACIFSWFRVKGDDKHTHMLCCINKQIHLHLPRRPANTKEKQTVYYQYFKILWYVNTLVSYANGLKYSGSTVL